VNAASPESLLAPAAAAALTVEQLMQKLRESRNKAASLNQMSAAIKAEQLNDCARSHAPWSTAHGPKLGVNAKDLEGTLSDGSKLLRSSGKRHGHDGDQRDQYAIGSSPPFSTIGGDLRNSDDREQLNRPIPSSRHF
jgi:hypothetical protein